MTATSNGFNFYSTLLTSLLCLGVMLVGGWYFQSSLIEMRIEIMAQQQDATKQMTEVITKHRMKSNLQAEIIQQLKETVKKQNKQLNQIQVQLQVTQKLLNVSKHVCLKLWLI